MLLRRALRFRRLLIAAARSTQGGGGPPLTPAVYSASAASARLHTRPAAWQSVSEKGSSASDPHVTSAVGSEATSATAAPAATIQGAELTAEDYQQLTPDEFAAVADVYIGEGSGWAVAGQRGLRCLSISKALAAGLRRQLPMHSYAVCPMQAAYGPASSGACAKQRGR
jgi:hypothetical protein